MGVVILYKYLPNIDVGILDKFHAIRNSGVTHLKGQKYFKAIKRSENVNNLVKDMGIIFGEYVVLFIFI